MRFPFQPTTIAEAGGDVRRSLPAWARLLDLLTVAVAVLASVVLVFGGWRFAFFGVDLRIKTWWRELVWAFGIAILRHWLVRRPSLVERLGRGYADVRAVLLARGGWPSAFAAAAAPVVFSRVMVYGVGLFALAAFGLPGATPEDGPPRLDLLSRWDATWYISIAEQGYTHVIGPGRESPVVFFPGLPMLMRAGAWLTGADAAHVGFVVSMIAFWWGAAYVYRIARDQFHLDAPHAAVSFLAWYPFAVWFGAVYTESLLLLALAGAFYHARAGHRLPTAAWGFVAALVKTNGFVVALPLAVIYGLRLLRHSTAGWRVWRDRRALRHAAADALALCAPALALAAYSGYLWWLTGDPLAWLHGQQAWDRVFRTPGELLDTMNRHLVRGLVAAIVENPFDVINAAAVIFALAAVVPIYLRLGAAEALLVLVILVPPLLAGGTTSMARFTSCLFPIFLWLAAALPAPLRPTVCGLFGGGQAFSAAVFLTWRHLV